MFALRRRAIGVSVALAAAATLTATLLISTALAQDPDPSITSITVTDITMTTATVTVNLANDDADGTTVYLKFGPVNTYITSPKPPAYNVGNESGQDRWLYIYDDADPLQTTSTSGAATFSLPRFSLARQQAGAWRPTSVGVLRSQRASVAGQFVRLGHRNGNLHDAPTEGCWQLG